MDATFPKFMKSAKSTERHEQYNQLFGKVKFWNIVENLQADQCENHSRVTSDASEHCTDQLRVQYIVEATWLFDAGADAHVMLKHVCEQLGELELQPTSVSLSDKTLEQWANCWS